MESLDPVAVVTSDRRLRLSLLIRLLRLVEQEICSQLLVLVASEVGLDDQIALKSQSAQPLNGLPLFLGNANGLGARRQRGVLISVLGEQLQELIWVTRNKLGQLRVASYDLLQDGLEHRRLLLYDLTKLLELRIVT